MMTVSRSICDSGIVCNCAVIIWNICSWRSFLCESSSVYTSNVWYVILVLCSVPLIFVGTSQHNSKLLVAANSITHECLSVQIQLMSMGSIWGKWSKLCMNRLGSIWISLFLSRHLGCLHWWLWIIHVDYLNIEIIPLREPSWLALVALMHMRYLLVLLHQYQGWS